jgi:hypothetical protein
VEAGALAEAKRGHLALDYTCMKWVQLSSKVRRPPISRPVITARRCARLMCLCFGLAEEAEGWELAACAWDGQWGCPRA